MREESLRVLMIEDSQDDALLVIRELKKGGYNTLSERVETSSDMAKALKDKQWDVIICDYHLPKFNASSALFLLKEENLDIPLIVVTGAVGEEAAVECMHLGAKDYIMKSNLSRLCPAIARELEEVKVRCKQRLAEAQRESMLDELRRNEERYRKITSCIPDSIWTMDLSGKFIYANEAVTRLTGWTADEYLKLTLNDLVSPEQAARDVNMLFEELEKMKAPSYDRNATLTYASEELRKDGSRFWAEVTATFLWSDDGTPVGIIGVTRDITERRKTEKILHENEARLRGITNHLPGVIFQFYAKDNGEYGINYVSESLKEYLGLMATMNTEDNDNLYLSFVSQIHEEDRDRFLASVKQAVETEKPWNFEGRVRYKTNGNPVWFQGLATPTRQEDQLVFDGILLDVTERKSAEEKLKQSLESLRKSIGTTIQVMISAIEMRDPYTAGHQSRSTKLACDIAAEMGFPQDRIEGIRMAGNIHDIGKLSIPAEILIKPSKLTDLEFMLIQEHPKSGYEMLKDIESPWPLAETVLQHHERMNGSGYPGNLKGDDIILEARVLAVADVVEAMASHRPYRASLGIAAALEEIEKNKGILYDDAVADACLRLFREKSYKLD